MVVEAVLTAAESIVTFRRRYRGRAGVEALLELLVIDPFNPRSVAYQLQRIRPISARFPTPRQQLDRCGCWTASLKHVRTSDPVDLAESADGRRSGLHDFLAGLQDQLLALSDAIRDQYQQQPPTQRPLFRPDALGGTA